MSGAVKLIKPDAAIYQMLIERNGLTPESCVFIDDKPENCAAARDIGMDAIRFTDPNDLASALQERGFDV